MGPAATPNGSEKQKNCFSIFQRSIAVPAILLYESQSTTYIGNAEWTKSLTPYVNMILNLLSGCEGIFKFNGEKWILFPLTVKLPLS